MDRRFQIGYAVERAAADSFAGQFAKPSFHEIEPTGTGRHEMADEARVALQPLTDFGVLVRAVVIHDQMQRGLSRELPIQPPEEAKEFLVAVPLMAFSDHPSL